MSIETRPSVGLIDGSPPGDEPAALQAFTKLVELAIKQPDKTTAVFNTSGDTATEADSEVVWLVTDILRQQYDLAVDFDVSTDAAVRKWAEQREGRQATYDQRRFRRVGIFITRIVEWASKEENVLV